MDKTITFDGDTIDCHDELLKVELVDIGEGLQGDYNEEDPFDCPLMRFDVYIRDPKAYEENPESAGWEEVEDASYCTNLSAWAPATILGKATEAIFDKYRAEITSYPLSFSVKKLGEWMSHICENEVLMSMDEDELEELYEDVINAREVFPENSTDPAALYYDNLYAEIDEAIQNKREVEEI